MDGWDVFGWALALVMVAAMAWSLLVLASYRHRYRGTSSGRPCRPPGGGAGVSRAD